MSFLSSIGGSILRGGLVKNLGKKLVKGISRGAGKIVKGVKRGATKASLGVKRLGAQIKALPDSFKRAKAAAFPKKPQVMGITKKGKVMITKAPVGRSFKEKVSTFFKQLTRWQKRAGDKLVKKEQAQRLAKVLNNIYPANKLTSKWKNLTAKLKPGETWLQAGKRRLFDAVSGGKKLLNTALKEGAENIAVDQTLKMAGAVGLGLGGAAVAGAATGAVIESKK